jgi:NTP pyrophosphatase (non-canonical NTP hydrolase)
MKDTETTIESLKKIIETFVCEREWQQFHTPKNMSMQIATEAAELMELFLWVESNKSFDQLEKKRQAIEEEIADVVFALLNFCVHCNIDLSKAIENKMEINARNYPVEKAKGNSRKYNEL